MACGFIFFGYLRQDGHSVAHHHIGGTAKPPQTSVAIPRSRMQIRSELRPGPQWDVACPSGLHDDALTPHSMTGRQHVHEDTGAKHAAPKPTLPQSGLPAGPSPHPVLIAVRTTSEISKDSDGQFPGRKHCMTSLSALSTAVILLVVSA